MNKQTCKTAGTPKACLKKTTELFYFTHPKTLKALLEPFRAKADAEYGRVVIRSAGAEVRVCIVGFRDEFAHRSAMNNSHAIRGFADGDRKGAM